MRESMRVLVFDLETDRLLCKTRDDHRELRVTVGQFCAFDWEPGSRPPSASDREWTEYVDDGEGASLGSLVVPLMDDADRIVAYNGRGFDLAVLRGCEGVSDADVKRWTKKLRDPFDAIRDSTGSWVKLEELLEANALPFRKSGDGVSAVEWWAGGEKRRVADYCRGDVEGLVALVELDKIVFPIKTWRLQHSFPQKQLPGAGVVDCSNSNSSSSSNKRLRSSVQIVTGWAELDWTAYLFLK